MERPNTLRMSTIALDWLDVTLILSILAACAVVGWLAGCLIRRLDIAVRDRKIRLRHQPPTLKTG